MTNLFYGYGSPVASINALNTGDFFMVNLSRQQREIFRVLLDGPDSGVSVAVISRHLSSLGRPSSDVIINLSLKKLVNLRFVKWSRTSSDPRLIGLTDLGRRKATQIDFRQDAVFDELQDISSELGGLTLSPGTIYELERSGFIVDLLTGEIRPDIDLLSPTAKGLVVVWGIRAGFFDEQ